MPGSLAHLRCYRDGVRRQKMGNLRLWPENLVSGPVQRKGSEIISSTVICNPFIHPFAYRVPALSQTQMSEQSDHQLACALVLAMCLMEPQNLC